MDTSNENDITRLAGRLEDLAHEQYQANSIGFLDASDLRRAADLLRAYDAQRRAPDLTERMHHDHIAMEALRYLSHCGPGGVHVCVRPTRNGMHTVVRVRTIDDGSGYRRSGTEQTTNMIIDAGNAVHRAREEWRWRKRAAERDYHDEAHTLREEGR